MNGIEKITARIKKDAGAEAEAIRREGEERAASIRAGYKAQAEENAKAAAQAGKEAAKRQEERLVSAAQMDAKKLLLAAKQACIDEAFDKAQEKLLALPDGEYAELLAKLAVKAAKTGKEEILLSAKDRKRVGEQVVAKANALGKFMALTLGKETRDMAGGLILRDGSVEINCAFETQMRGLRESMASDVAALLFA